MARAHSWRWAALLLLVMAAAIYPALAWNSGAVAHDAALEHILRGLTFSEAIDDGVLYPRWVQFLHLGLGSPIFTFQGPLPYYGLDLLYRLGLGHPLGWRVLMALALLAAGTGTFLLIYEITMRRWPALVAAVAFLYAPYVLRNTLERGSNEAFSMVLYPWVLWGLLRLARQPSAGRFVIATLLWSACIAAHVLGPLMLAPVAALLAIFLGWRYRTWAPLLALLAGGLLTAFIWAPMIPEQAYVQVHRDFSSPDALPWDNPIPVDILLAPPAVYDVARDNNAPGDRIGLLQTLLLLMGVPATAYAWLRGRRDLALWLGGATALGILLLWLFTTYSDEAWRLLAPVLGRVQYRTRPMGLQALAAAATAGLVVAVLPLRWQRLLGPALVAVLALVALPSLYIDLQHHYVAFTTAATQEEVRQVEARMGAKALTAYGEFTPIWRTDPFDQAAIAAIGTELDAAATPLAAPSSAVQLLAADVKTQAWDLQMEARAPITLTLNLLYYPRWQALVDGQEVALRPEPGSGLAQLAVSAGTHEVALRYRRTAAEWIGFGISGLALALLVVLTGRAVRGRRWVHLEQPAQPIDLAPPVWLLLGIAGLLAFKAFYVDPQTTWLRCVSTAERVCGAEAAVDIPFAGGHRLRGYAVPSQRVQPGDQLRVTLVWQGEPGVTSPLHSFVHVRNSLPDQPVDPRSGSEIWAQQDHPAPAGLLTTEFVPGKLYLDELRVPIPADMPPGEYRLEAGWFDPASGEQLEPAPAAVQEPLGILWRSILLPPVTVE